MSLPSETANDNTYYNTTNTTVSSCNVSSVVDYLLSLSMPAVEPPPYPGSLEAERVREWTPRFGLLDDVIHLFMTLRRQTKDEDDDDWFFNNSTNNVTDSSNSTSTDTWRQQQQQQQDELSSLGDASSSSPTLLSQSLEEDPNFNEYIKSVVAPVIALALVLAAWVGLLLLWKYRYGPQRVGCLSGKHPVTLPPPPLLRETNDNSLHDNKSNTHNKTHKSNNFNENEKQVRPDQCRRTRRIRYAVILAGMGVLVGSIVTMAIGMQEFADAKNQTVLGLQQGQALAERGVLLLDEFLAAHERIRGIIGNFLLVNETFHGFCPAVTTDICRAWFPDNDVVQQSTMDNNGEDDIFEIRCDFQGIPYADLLEPLVDFFNRENDNACFSNETLDDIINFNETYNDIMHFNETYDDAYFNETNSTNCTTSKTLEQELRDAREDVMDLALTLQAASGTVQSWDIPFQISRCFVALLAVSVVSLLICLYLVWRNEAARRRQQQQQQELDNNTADKPPDFNVDNDNLPIAKPRSCGKIEKYFQVRIWMPIFAGLATICAIAALIGTAGSITSADFCYDNPDEILLEMLEYSKEEFNGETAYWFSLYIVRGCNLEQKPPDMDRELFWISRIFEALIFFVKTVQANLDQLEDVCAINDAVPFLDAIEELANEACSLAMLLLGVAEFFSCENWHSLYRTVVYKAVCDDGVKSLHWIAVPMTIISVCALIVVTLRIAFVESDPNDAFRDFAVADGATSQVQPTDDREFPVQEGATELIPSSVPINKGAMPFDEKKEADWPDQHTLNENSIGCKSMASSGESAQEANKSEAQGAKR